MTYGPLHTGFANCVRNIPAVEDEARLFRALKQALAGYPVLVGFNKWIPYSSHSKGLLALSHFTHERYDYVKSGSDWTTAGILDARDFSLVAGIPGTDRKWRAVILVTPEVDSSDDSIRRVWTRHGSDEFSFPFTVPDSSIFWSMTEWQ